MYVSVNVDLVSNINAVLLVVATLSLHLTAFNIFGVDKKQVGTLQHSEYVLQDHY